MSKFCSSCGTELADLAVMCPQCGTEQPQTAPAAQPPAAEEAPAADVAVTVAPAKSKLPLFIGIGAGAVVAVVLVVILLINLLAPNFNKAIDAYIDFMMGDVESVTDMLPASVWENLAEKAEMDVDEFQDECMDMLGDYSRLEYLEEEYGDNIKITYKVTDKEKMDEDDLDDLRDSLKESLDISKKSVTEAYELEVELNVKGDDDEDSDETDMIVVKIDGDFYLVTMLETIGGSMSSYGDYSDYVDDYTSYY